MAGNKVDAELSELSSLARSLNFATDESAKTPKPESEAMGDLRDRINAAVESTYGLPRSTTFCSWSGVRSICLAPQWAPRRLLRRRRATPPTTPPPLLLLLPRTAWPTQPAAVCQNPRHPLHRWAQIAPLILPH